MSGTLWTWGRAFGGRLGNGTTTPDVLVPTQIGALDTWAVLALFADNAAAIKADGTLWTWGRAVWGVLGNGTTTPDVLTPTQIGSDTDWAKLAQGYYHAHAIKVGGTLWGWGSNGDYNLGDGTQIQRNSPVQIGSATTWSQVSCGHNHSGAVRTDGTLWMWGDDFEGELGNGATTGYITTPTQIGALTTWAEVACGVNFTFARRSDGTLWSTGLNNSGQLGLGDLSVRTSFTQVGVATNWAKVSCGDAHTLAIKTNGTLWACGENSSGAVGDGSTTDRTSFVQIGSDTDWAHVEAGYYHSTAVKSDGRVYGWGEAAFGGVGNGTTTPNALVPTLIYTGNSGTFSAGGLSFGAFINAVIPPPNEFWTGFVGTSELFS